MSEDASIVVVEPLKLVPSLHSMAKGSGGNIAAIIILIVIAVGLLILVIYLNISNSRKFAAVDYESDEDELSDEENHAEEEVRSNSMSSISEDGSDDAAAPQVGSEGGRRDETSN